MHQEQIQPDTAVPDDEEKKRVAAEERRLRRLRRLFPFLLVVVFLVYAFTTNLIPSSSMEPTLNPGDQILTMRSWLAYFGGRVPARGDIVIFNLPPQQSKNLGADAKMDAPEGRKPIGVFRNPPGEILIKRVVGLPGETISLSNGQILANGNPIPQPYRTVPPDPGTDDEFTFAGEKPVKLGSDEVFLMGDNRLVSEDSRFFGPVKLRNIRGKYVMTLFHRNVQDPAEEELKRSQERAAEPLPAYRRPRMERGR